MVKLAGDPLLGSEFSVLPTQLICFLCECLGEWRTRLMNNNIFREARGWHCQNMFSVIVWVRLVFRKTAVGDCCFHYLSSSHLQSRVKSRRQMMVFMSLVMVWIGTTLTRTITLNITDNPGFKPFTIVQIISWLWCQFCCTHGLLFNCEHFSCHI